MVNGLFIPTLSFLTCVIVTVYIIKLVGFADDTRLYSGVGDVTDCDNLQLDLNAVYDWASSNNMFF